MSQGSNVEGNRSIPQELLGQLRSKTTDSLTRLSRLPSTIRGGLAINKRSLLLVAGAGLLVSAVALSACGVGKQASNEVTPTGRLNQAAAGLEPATPATPISRPGEQLKQYLDNYIKNRLQPEFIRFDQQISPIIGTSPVDLEVRVAAGVWAREVPGNFTEQGFETRVKTGKMEPYFKAYRYNPDYPDEIMGEYRQFVAVLDKNNKLRSI